MRSLTKDVYDFPGSGDKVKNNGQVWEEFGTSEEGWTTERSLRGKCQEELDADWNRRIAQVAKETSASHWIHEQYSAAPKKSRPQMRYPEKHP
jgi:hypothetical protein